MGNVLYIIYISAPNDEKNIPSVFWVGGNRMITCYVIISFDIHCEYVEICDDDVMYVKNKHLLICQFKEARTACDDEHKKHQRAENMIVRLEQVVNGGS